MRYHGLEGIRTLIRHHIDLTQMCAEWMKSHPYLEFFCPPSLNLICFYFKIPKWTYTQNQEFNQDLMDYLNTQGLIYLTHVQLEMTFVLRLCIGQRTTEQIHVQQAWTAIQDAFSTLSRQRGLRGDQIDDD
jgi:glutamate/tyrosine decarboxylase-like PLP-dependent enzyme